MSAIVHISDGFMNHSRSRTRAAVKSKTRTPTLSSTISIAATSRAQKRQAEALLRERPGSSNAVYSTPNLRC